MTILAFIAVAELIAAGWVFMTRFQAAQGFAALGRPPQNETHASPDLITRSDPLPEKSLVVEDLGVETTMEADSEGVISRPKPVIPNRPEPTVEARVAEMVEQSKALRARGDASAALTKSQEALVLAPGSSIALAESAVSFEKLGRGEKALEQWRKIFEQGESAGIYYQAAEAKLNVGRGTNNVAEAGPDTNTVHRDSEEFQPGSDLGLGEITIEEQIDPAAAKKFTLQVPLKARPAARIDVRDTVIQVFFYDIIDKENIVQTSATVSSRWGTLPVDWANGATEVLNVDYLQPKTDAAAAGKKETKDAKSTENRQYFGYQVRVYYKKELQAMRADPAKLLKQFKPPLTLQVEQPK